MGGWKRMSRAGVCAVSLLMFSGIAALAQADTPPAGMVNSRRSTGLT